MINEGYYSNHQSNLLCHSALDAKLKFNQMNVSHFKIGLFALWYVQSEIEVEQVIKKDLCEKKKS
jgi:hypothetical protein